MVTKAIILVAGKEKKLYPLTEDIHQCLFSLGDRTIIEDMLLKLSNQGITDIVLVVGHKQELIKKKLGYKYKKLKISYVENPDFETTHVAYSLWLARKHINEDFLLIDGDIICEEDFIEAVIKAEAKDLIAIDNAQELSEGYVISKVVKNRIVKIGRNLKIKADLTAGHSIGISKFSLATALLLVKEIGKFINKRQLSVIYEDALNLILDKVNVSPLFSRAFNWFEIDKTEEFEKAKKFFGDTSDLKSLAKEYGAEEVYIILPSNIIFDERALLQCSNCKNYTNKRTCPPNLMDLNYKEMISKYRKGLLVLVKFDSAQNFEKARYDSTNKLHSILLKLEKDAFNQDNHFTTSFIGGSCKLCPGECAPICRNPQRSRIPLEGIGVDVVETLKQFGVILKFPVVDCIYRVGLLLVG